ncbi:hypothetical protein POF50_021670 [Streptomyces sp. SL13]|uniref:Uncharacterized protein n=1 Tax=Streptantibioticus silvisoli TaxID=2705255 RepID=A0AA90KHJ4_9ACTN|nr:hypothetical protein [Streptantibioticus silvisoli]MDI5971910.1 hypothetical protein [Streptantibioticus silvisoli]
MAALNAWTVRPEDYHQAGDTDWTAAFRKLFADVGKRLATDAGGSVPVSTVEVLLTGVYTVSNTIMPAVSGRAQGLTVRGLGKRSSEIVMAGAAPLLVNTDRWMGVTWYDCSFRSTNKAADFLHSNCSDIGGAQDWNFVRCEWRGTWGNGIVLDGPRNSNCNSEWVFDRCTVTGSYENAWLWSGRSGYPAQDQFLNFSLRDCKVEYQYGTALRFDKGGSIAISGGSWILEGTRPDGARSRFIQLAGGSHYDSVQKLAVRDVRFELRNVTHQVINSAWSDSQIVFDGCDDTALGFEAFSAALIAHEYTDPGIVSYRNCALVGKHAYHQTKQPGRSGSGARYIDCTRKNNRTNATFIARTVAPGMSPGGVHVQYVDDGDGIA